MEGTFFQVKLVFPTGLAAEVAKQLAENGIITNLSYSFEDGIFNQKIACIISYPEDKKDRVSALFNKYIKS